MLFVINENDEMKVKLKSLIKEEEKNVLNT